MAQAKMPPWGDVEAFVSAALERAIKTRPSMEPEKLAKRQELLSLTVIDKRAKRAGMTRAEAAAELLKEAVEQITDPTEAIIAHAFLGSDREYWGRSVLDRTQILYDRYGISADTYWRLRKKVQPSLVTWIAIQERAARLDGLDDSALEQLRAWGRAAWRAYFYFYILWAFRSDGLIKERLRFDETDGSPREIAIQSNYLRFLYSIAILQTVYELFVRAGPPVWLQLTSVMGERHSSDPCPTWMSPFGRFRPWSIFDISSDNIDRLLFAVKSDVETPFAKFEKRFLGSKILISSFRASEDRLIRTLDAEPLLSDGRRTSVAEPPWEVKNSVVAYWSDSILFYAMTITEYFTDVDRRSLTDEVMAVTRRASWLLPTNQVPESALRAVDGYMSRFKGKRNSGFGDRYSRNCAD